MERKIEWNTSRGPVAVTVALVTERVIDDNLNITKPVCEIEITASTPAGVFRGRPVRKLQIINGVQVSATIGKLAIRPEHLAMIDTAISEIEATPEWQTHAAKQRQGAADMAKIEAGRETMRRVMGY